MKFLDARGNPVLCSGCGGDEGRTPTAAEAAEVREHVAGVRLMGVFTCCPSSLWVEAVTREALRRRGLRRRRPTR